MAEQLKRAAAGPAEAPRPAKRPRQDVADDRGSPLLQPSAPKQTAEVDAVALVGDVLSMVAAADMDGAIALLTTSIGTGYAGG